MYWKIYAFIMHTKYKKKLSLATTAFSDIPRHAWFNSTWFNFKFTAFTTANTTGRQLKYATNSGVKWVPLKPQTDDYCRCFGVYTVAHDRSAVKWFYGIHKNRRLCTCVIECSAFDTTAFIRLRTKNQALECCHIHSTTFIRLGPGVAKSMLTWPRITFVA